MSTHDVPGANGANGDELAMGCWAEHPDGSLIFVESTEGNRVIYSIFDMDRDPPLEYRDAMPETSFKTTFTWKPGGKGEKWTWHDKTPFPWDRIIEQGFSDGTRPAAAEHTLNAAERIMNSRQRHGSTAARRVADALELQGQELDRQNIDHRMDQVLHRIGGIMSKLTTAINKLTPDKGRGKRS